MSKIEEVRDFMKRRVRFTNSDIPQDKWTEIARVLIEERNTDFVCEAAISAQEWDAMTPDQQRHWALSQREKIYG